MKYLLLFVLLLTISCHKKKEHHGHGVSVDPIEEEKEKKTKTKSALEVKKESWVRTIKYYDNRGRKYADLYSERNLPVHGFTVRLYTGQSRKEAEKAVANLNRIFDEKDYVFDYDSPNYRVYIGLIAGSIQMDDKSPAQKTALIFEGFIKKRFKKLGIDQRVRKFPFYMSREQYDNNQGLKNGDIYRFLYRAKFKEYPAI